VRRHPLLVAIVTIVAAAVLIAGAGLAVRTAVPTARPAPSSSAARRAAAAEAGWPRPEPIAWHRCSSGVLVSAECATVAVPLDWNHPKGATIHLAVSRVRHTTTPYEGPILVNPGGPGVSGLRLATLGSEVPGGVGERYDWIGFDPRGVGASRPRISCIRDYGNGPKPPYGPPTQQTIATWLARAKGYAAACAKNGPLLDHLTTEDSAKDLEYLRLALRAPAISYYGYSYGTYLGQVYATLFPSRIRRMVLDSNVDPRRVWYRANLDQDAAFQTTIEAWFRWVARADSTYHLGGTALAVEQRYAAVAAELRQHPADGVLGPDELSDTVLEAGYDAAWWPELAQALAEEVSLGDPGRLVHDWRSINEPTDDNGYAVYLAVDCTDAAWPADWATWQRDSARVDARATFETWPNTWFNAPCLAWPAKPHRPVPIDGGSAPPALLIDETLDAATPYGGSLEVRARFPRARLLAEPGGTTHADSLSGNSCVDGAVGRYLGSGTLPDRRPGRTADLTCPPLPAPSPG
jgi:pimeloyl-ACP methyl ester carboxylesterase